MEDNIGKGLDCINITVPHITLQKDGLLFSSVLKTPGCFGVLKCGGMVMVMATHGNTTVYTFNNPNVVFSTGRCTMNIVLVDLKLTSSLLTFHSYKSLLKYSHAYRTINKVLVVQKKRESFFTNENKCSSLV